LVDNNKKTTQLLSDSLNKETADPRGNFAAKKIRALATNMFCCCSGEDGTLAEVDAKPAVDEVGEGWGLPRGCHVEPKNLGESRIRIPWEILVVYLIGILMVVYYNPNMAG